MPLNKRALEKAWKHVGRFMWGFAIVESFVDEIFVRLFNLGDIASLIFRSVNLDLRRKIKLVELGLKHQGRIEQSKTLKRVHELHNIRNVIAHSGFHPVTNGIDFHGYVNPCGDLRLPDRPETEALSDTEITYSDFDSYDAQARELWDALLQICESVTPITDVGVDLASAIEEAISSSALH